MRISETRPLPVRLASLLASLVFLVPPVLATATEPVVVKTYLQELGIEYPGLVGEAADVRAVDVTPDQQFYAGTAAGLYRLQQETWIRVPTLEGKPVTHLAHDPDGRLLAVYDGALVDMSGKRLAALPGRGPYYRLAAQGGKIALASQDGLYYLEKNHFVPDTQRRDLASQSGCVLAWAASGDGTSVVGTPDGLLRCQSQGAWTAVFPKDGMRRWAPEHVGALGFDSRGRLWFTSTQGLGCCDAGRWQLYSGAEGLPYNGFSSMAFGADGRVWLGTDRGAICFDGKHWAYREGRRWLPDNRVRSLAVARDGTALCATPKGMGVLQRKPMRLADKARFFEDEIDKRHRRTPLEYVLSVRLKQPGDKSQWIQQDSDNDGQWSGMYGAAECFAYAATRDPKAKERATKAFEALRWFSEVTQGGSHPAPKGFVARCILPTSGPDPNTWPSYSIEADQREQQTHTLWKVLHPRWPTSADGKWYWKCDTSSDELDGHYFLYGRYYDLVAETDQEKERVRQVVRAITDHLLEHNYRLVDWDGRPTRWANFSPDSLNHDPEWAQERGLNSLSMLTYLRTAAHITGDAKYDKAADELVSKHGYAINAMVPKKQRGPGSFTQFDDEMAMMNYYGLLRYEKDPKLRRMFLESCFEYWELEACELNSFYNFTCAACCENQQVQTAWGPLRVQPSRECLEEAVETLQRYPMNLVDWRQTNSHRLDIVPLPSYAREPGRAKGMGSRTNGKVLPIDERVILQWSDDPWQLDSGGDGRELATGSPFLLAYYMGLYHGFIVEK